MNYNKKSPADAWAFLAENYLQFFAEEFVLALLASFEASTFLACFDILELLDAFPALEFLPNIVFTSYSSRQVMPCYHNFV